MYDKLNITENHLQALALFTRGFDKELYVREVQKLLGVSPRTAQLVLADLEGKAVLESRSKGKIKLYGLKKNSKAKEYLIFTEAYKKISFLQKNDLLREIFEKCAPGLNGIVLLFGSYAKGMEKADSDIDILVVGEYDRSHVETVSRMYRKNISVKKYPQSMFTNEMNADNLFREVLNDHVVLQGLEEFIAQVIKWTK
jgi:predicted nucleotidyltransferase